MSLFNNQNFIAQIIKYQRASELFDPQGEAILQTMVQLQVRKLIELAAKFMRKSRRDVLLPEDIQLAVSELDHNDIRLYSTRDNYFHKDQDHILSNPVFKSAQDFFMEENKLFTQQTYFEAPMLKRRWIYIEGKIPRINENQMLKCYADIKNIKNHQEEEKKKLFNVIRDEPDSLLTKQEAEYYQEVVELISNNNIRNLRITFQNGVRGNIVSLVPMFLRLIVSINNECGLVFLLKMLENKYIWNSIQSHTHQILSILLSYQGKYAVEVGTKVAQIVNRFGETYTALYDIYENVEDTYSNVAKKVMLEVITGVRVQLREEFLLKCKKEAQENDNMAALCLKVVVSNWGKIHCLSQIRNPDIYGKFFWLPSKQMKSDPYINMIMF